MNWRAESTGDPLPLSRSATQLAEIMAKLDRPCEFRPPEMRVPPRSCSARVRPHRTCYFALVTRHRDRGWRFASWQMTKSKTLIFCPPHRCRGAAEKRDELAPSHSITSSARASSVDRTFATQSPKAGIRCLNRVARRRAPSEPAGHRYLVSLPL
jgi:hypothetical protein